MPENVLEFTDSNFEAEVINADLPVVIDFWAEWCGPCKPAGVIIEQLANKTVGSAKVGKVDVDHSRAVAMKYGISAIPTIIIFKSGQAVKKFVGLTPLAELKSAVDDLASPQVG